MKAVHKFGRIVKKARHAKGWSQQKVADEVNKLLKTPKDRIIRQTIVNLEAGVLKKNLSAERRMAFCKVLNIDETEMTNLTDDPSPQDAVSLEEHDVLPLIKQVGGTTGLEKLTFKQLRLLCEADQRLKETGLDLTSVLKT